MNIPKPEDLNCSNCTSRSMKVHYPEFLQMLEEKYPSVSHKERLYWYYNNIIKRPVCKVCGKETAFVDWHHGYREFCGYKCMNSCREVQDKKKVTSMKNYGCSNPMQNQEVREKLKKTFREKYGVDNVFQSEHVKSKIKETNQRKRGVDHHLQTEECKEKMIQTKIANKIDSLLQEHNLEVVDIVTHGKGCEDDYIIKCPCENCDKCSEKKFVISSNHLYDRLRWGTPLCTTVYPIQQIHSKDTSLEMFVRDLLDIHNIKYETNKRGFFEDHKQKELDILIPSRQIAIECNDIWSHSWTNQDQHKYKFVECKKKGVQLLTVWEDWIKNKPEIIKSIILSKLGIYDCKIYGRNTEVVEITKRECDKFLNENHIQGAAGAKVRVGLKYNGEIVSVMTFSQNPYAQGSTKNDKDAWILARFCNKKFTQVIGGASKLLKFFVNNYNPKTIISFSSNDISDGTLYKKLGFETDGEINVSYWYIKGLKRYHRSMFTKSNLKNMGYSTEGKTETQIMREAGYDLIYDCGTTKWVLKVNP